MVLQVRRQAVTGTDPFGVLGKLVVDVGYWDPIVIAEDWHMFLRCFFAKDGDMTVRSMFLPTIGEPFLAKIQERCRATLPHFKSEQAYLADMPQLILYEMGVHYLDTFRFLFGEPATIMARLHHISPQMQGEDVQVILLTYPRMTGLIDSSWASVPVPGWDIPRDGSLALVAWKDGDRKTLQIIVFGPDAKERLRADCQWHFL